jgi:hypothetical protein
MIGLLSFIFVWGCKSDKNLEATIETNSSVKHPLIELKSTTQSNITQEIDDDAMIELDQWTSFFILKKELQKLEQNKANGFQENEKRIETYFKDLNLNIPEIFNTNTIWARLKVLETELYLYNEISNVEHSQDLINSARKKSLKAYQNLVRQINKTHEKATQNFNQ